MTALKMLSGLRERGAQLLIKLSGRKGVLEMLEMMDRHETDTGDLLAAPPIAAEPPPATPAGRPSKTSLLDQAIELSSVRNWNKEEQDAYVRYVAPYKGFLAHRLALDKKFVRAEGCYLFDAEGTRYADFIANFGAVPFGHNPETIWQAMEAMRRESQPNLVMPANSAPAGDLAEKLLAVAPPGLGHVTFTNSGVEAVETAIKLARCRSGRLGILSARDGFHGHTLAGMSASSDDFFRRDFGAPATGFDHVEFGDLDALEAALKSQADFFAAFLVQIVQGESGVRVAPEGYLAAALELCHRYGALLIVDEVETGLGRTGTMFACEAEGITPDILTIAHALGGGLMPIGACLYVPAVYTEEFELRHWSYCGENALACRAGLASIEMLTKNDQRLVRHVATLGYRLEQQLRELQREFPQLIVGVRGRGLMLGLDLDLKQVATKQTGMLAILQRHELLLCMAVSYLLNVEHIRIAPSFRHGSVLRVEPPLTADEAVCDQLIIGLRRLFDMLQRGDAGEMLDHLMKTGRSSTASRLDGRKRHQHVAQPALAEHQPGAEKVKRFGYVVHLLGTGDLRRFDPSLDLYTDAQLEAMRLRIAEFRKPFPLDKMTINSADGTYAEGELIMLPYLPSELLSLSGKAAVDLVQSAVDLAASRGAQVVGLGGFSSIICYGGNALEQRPGVTVTSGNSLTTWAALQSIEANCAKLGRNLADCTVAIVGANGAIGHALTMLFAERAGELVLVGNPRNPEASVRKLRRVALDCRRHVGALVAEGRTFAPGTLAGEMVEGRTYESASKDELESRIMLTTDIDQHLPRAHIVLTATKAVLPFIASKHLGKGALVCDVSRPFNVAPEVFRRRPDLHHVSGGLIKAPDTSELGYIEERDRAKVLMSCAAETIMLALSGYESRHLCGKLEIETIEEIGRHAQSFGFSVVD
jgi:acetylornithine/succinyldiaminopimelate/putrescine aminotransferase/predicted amino acid dehydrogenase